VFGAPLRNDSGQLVHNLGPLSPSSMFADRLTVASAGVPHDKLLPKWARLGSCQSAAV